MGASRGLSRKVMFLVTNYRIFLTRRTSCHAENHGWSRMSVMNFLFYHELSNYRIVSSHGESRRSRIIELSNFLHTECRGRSRVFLFITDCRIFFFTRSVAEGHGGSSFLGLSNCFFTRRVAEGHELSNYLHTECRRRSRIFLHTECWECGGVGDEEGWVLVFVCDS